MKIMFVCHGNICRSPMAEFVMRDIAEKNGCKGMIQISSSATSYEEIGNPVHRGTKNKLSEYGISVEGKYAVKFVKEDYDKYDLIIGMDGYNIKNILKITGGDPLGKVHKLLNFDNSDDDVADPWYTGDFDKTYDDILRGCKALYKKIIK